jgi:hypothetical protein
MKYNINQYHALRNKIWGDLISSGVTSDDDENFEAFDSVLGSHLNIDWENQDETIEGLTGIRQKLEALEEILDTNSSRTDWTDDEVSMEMDYMYGKVNEIKKDLEKLK